MKIDLSFTGYNDCNDAFNQGQTHSGVYRIKPDHLPAFDVSYHCI